MFQYLGCTLTCCYLIDKYRWIKRPAGRPLCPALETFTLTTILLRLRFVRYLGINQNKYKFIKIYNFHNKISTITGTPSFPGKDFTPRHEMSINLVKSNNNSMSGNQSLFTANFQL